MQLITVTFTHPRSSTAFDADLEPELTVAEVIAGLVDLGFLQERLPDQRAYRLSFNREQLSNATTLQVAGVRDGDTITVTEEARGGSPPVAGVAEVDRPVAADESSHGRAELRVAVAGDRVVPADTRRAALRAKLFAAADLLGGDAEMALVLDVPPSRVRAWKAGDLSPNADEEQRLIDVEYVATRASLVWNRSLVKSWMATPNSFLDGGRPVDVLRAHGPSEVIAALDAELAGSYA